MWVSCIFLVLFVWDWLGCDRKLVVCVCFWVGIFGLLMMCLKYFWNWFVLGLVFFGCVFFGGLNNCCVLVFFVVDLVCCLVCKYFVLGLVLVRYCNIKFVVR